MGWNQPEPWTLAIVISAGLAIWAHDPERIVLHWVFKPLTTVLLALLLLAMAPPTSTRHWFMVGLGLSLVGDVALMMPARWFRFGLLSFLLALLAYAVAFSQEVPLTLRQLAFLLLPLAVGALVLRSLWRTPQMGRLRWFAIAYLGAMGLMVWRVLSRFEGPQVDFAAWIWGCVGAALFMLADGLLANRRFAKKEIPYVLELGCYYLAQYCLVVSVWMA